MRSFGQNKGFLIGILGPPGVGKTTLSQRISKHLNIPYICVGDIIRNEIKNATVIGKKIETDINSGNIIDASISTQLMKDYISKNICDFKNVSAVFDGFPRSLEQNSLFKEQFDCEFDFIFHLTLPHDILIERLKHRRVCSNSENCNKIFNFYSISNENFEMKPILPINCNQDVCDICGNKLIKRTDDSLDIVLNRLIEYETKTMPVYDYFERMNKLICFEIKKGVNDDSRFIKVLNQNISTTCESKLL